MTTTPATDEGQIRALLDGVSQALRAKDAARLMSHYAPDVVQFSLAPHLTACFESYGAGRRLRFG